MVIRTVSDSPACQTSIALMPRIQLELPQLQNWSCHNCGGCCKQHGIYITAEEKHRIEGQGWSDSGDLPIDGEPVVTEPGRFGRRTHYRLAHQADGACVFLDEQGLCRIHGKFGEDAKPLACRIYPYAFHPKGDDIAVSLRFSCPSVTGNLGPPVARQRKQILELARQAVPKHHQNFAAPMLTPRVQLSWDESLTVVDTLDRSLEDAETPFLLKLLRTLFWLELIEQTNFQNIRGERLTELLELLTNAAPAELPTIPSWPAPAKIARTQFRLLAGQYARKDTFASMDTSLRGRWKQLRSALKLSAGRGRLPEFHPLLGSVPLEELDQPCGPLPEEYDELLTRYFRVKVQGMHFCGAAFYNSPLVSGFQALALTVPAILWIARWRALTDSRSSLTKDDLRTAMEIVDHQHGYSRVLGQWGAKKRVQTIAVSGNLGRLLVWYHGQQR